MTYPLEPAEERGLGRATLDREIRDAFSKLSAERIATLERRLVEEALHRGLVYERGGAAEAIRMMLRPVGIMPDTLAYLHYVSLAIQNAVKRLPDWYLQDKEIRRVVPLAPDEEQWLRDTWRRGHSEHNPVFGRMDASVDFTAPLWKESLKFLETNLSGIGGIHYTPTCELIAAEVELHEAQTVAPELDLEPGSDLRDLFVQELLDHLEATGRTGRNLCLVEPKYAGEGPVEQERLARYLLDEHGLRTLHADPADLHLKNDEVWFGDVAVDVAYRDYEVRDLLALERSGVDIEPMRTLFRENRIVSSMAGEFDHKSNFEILSDPQFTQRYFDAEERQVFRRHVLWTRVLSDRRTSLPHGDSADLLEHVRVERERLVIKPNRSYGGSGIVIGHLTDQSTWEGEIENALRDEPGTWVVQRLARIPVAEFPIIDAGGKVRVEPFFVVMGFAPTKYGVGILGRASQKMVVNVAQRGGLCAVLVGRPSTHLHGPAHR